MPTSFSVERRNPHHWDIYAESKRAFCIRGEVGNIFIRDERAETREKTDGFSRIHEGFKTVDAAMSWICSNLMFEKN